MFHLLGHEKKHIWIYLIEALLVAVFGFFSVHIHFEGLLKNNYVNDFGIKSVLFFLIFFAGSFLIIPILYGVIDICLELLSSAKSTGDGDATTFAREMFFWVIMGTLFFIPFFLTFYPGGIWADTFASIYAAKENILTNRHPLLYNLGIAVIVKICGLFSSDMNHTCAVLTLVQFVMMIGTFVYFLHWMIKCGIPHFIRIIISFFLFLSPIFMLYGISVWKDTPYSLAMMLWMMWSYDLYDTASSAKDNAGDKMTLEKRVYLRFILGAFLAAFLRNNGKYIVAVVLIFWIVIFLVQKISRKYVIGLAAFIICIFIVQGPIYGIIGVKETDTVEKYAIPLQQICAVVVNEGSLSDKDLSDLSAFVSPDEIKENFDPINADNVKWVESFDDEYLKAHQLKFIGLWLRLLAGNPGICFQEYLLSTCGFWDVTSNPNTNYAYVQTYVWDNFYNVSACDKWESLFGFSIKNKLVPKHYINGAALVWIFILLTFYMWTRYGIKAAIIPAPDLIMWITIMIATPIAVSFRYVSPMLFCMPVLVAVLILMTSNKVKEQ